jgi:hypothetical protein
MTGQRDRIPSLYGTPVRRATVDDQNALTVEFGGSERAAVFTTIASAWRWETADRMIIASGDDHGAVVAALSDLPGQTLTGVRTQRPSAAALLSFDDDSVLLVFPVTSDGSEYWSVEFPDGWAFTAGPGTDAGWDGPDPADP